MAKVQFQELSEQAEEKSTYTIAFSCYDEEGNKIVPNDLRWSLYKKNGTLVNSREDVELTPAYDVNIVLSGNDLAVVRGETRLRTLLVEGTYDSNLGVGLPLRDSCVFTIKDLKGVS